MWVKGKVLFMCRYDSRLLITLVELSDLNASVKNLNELNGT